MPVVGGGRVALWVLTLGEQSWYQAAKENLELSMRVVKLRECWYPTDIWALLTS